VGFRSYLLIFPFDGDIELGSLVVGVHGKQRALVSSDMLEFPQFGARVIQLLNVVEDLGIGQDLLKLIIID